MEQKTTKIVELGINVPYLQARKMVAKRGMKLPSYPLIDAYARRPRGYDLWADELLAHPPLDWVFQSGKDVKDSITGWILPASYVPKEALGRWGVGLFIVPEDVREEGGKVIVHAQSVVVLNGMIQISDTLVAGKPHEITRIPLIVSLEEFERLPEDEKRWLYRIAGEGVRPLVRGGWGRFDWRNVEAGYGSDFLSGVAAVSP